MTFLTVHQEALKRSASYPALLNSIRTLSTSPDCRPCANAVKFGNNLSEKKYLYLILFYLFYLIFSCLVLSVLLSQLIVSHFLVSYLINFIFILSYMSYPILSYPIPYYTVAHSNPFYLVLSYRIASFPTLSYPILSNLIASYLILMSCLISLIILPFEGNANQYCQARGFYLVPRASPIRALNVPRASLVTRQPLFPSSLVSFRR